MRTARKYILLIFFALCIWGIFIADAFSPATDFSEMENRPLEKAPELSARAVWNGSFTAKYEEYVEDQFAGRDAWISIKSIGESALGKLENNGIIYGKNGQMFEAMPAFDESQLQRNLGFIQEFAEKHEDCPVTLSIVPGPSAVLTELVPQGAPVPDQLGMLEAVRARLSDVPLEFCDLSSALRARAGEYIYYRTDHHWTTQGAHIAYSEYMSSLGREAVPPDTLIAHEIQDFYGTSYSKAKNWNARPDVITWYEVETTSVTVDGEPAQGLYDEQQWEKRDKYAAFLRGNNALTVVESSGENAYGKLLLIKDSYGNCLAPFLAASFERVDVVDLRYHGNLSGLLEQNEYDQIYILYSFSNLSTDRNLFKLTH